MRNNKKKSEKLTKDKITVDEIMIQSALIMVRTIAETKREGATVKFQTEANGDDYNIDITIKRVKEKLYLRVWKYIKSFFNKEIENPKIKSVIEPIFKKETVLQKV